MNRASVTRGNPDQQAVKHTIILCSSCTTVLKIDDAGLRPMTADEVNALRPESKASLLATRLVLQKVLAKKQQPIVLTSRSTSAE